MNFYKHYIGDFQRDTGHLSLTERGAYRAMLDHHYATEKPLPIRSVEICRLVGAHGKAERQAVERILQEFWEETPTGWVNKRALEEMEKAVKQRETNRRIGKRGGRPKKTESVSESDSELKPNQNPNQTPDTRKSSDTDVSDASASDLKAILFDGGLRWLAGKTGRSPPTLRGEIGRWIRDYGEGAVIEALAAAQRNGAVEPVAYINGALRNGQARASPSTANTTRAAVLKALERANDERTESGGTNGHRRGQLPAPGGGDTGDLHQAAGRPVSPVSKAG